MSTFRVSIMLALGTSLLGSGCAKGPEDSSTTASAHGPKTKSGKTSSPLAATVGVPASPTTPFFNPNPAPLPSGKTINVMDFIVPSQSRAYLTVSGPYGGPYGFGASTNYTDGGSHFYTVQSNDNPIHFLHWERGPNGIIARMDTTQKPYPYSYTHGVVLPAEAELNKEYTNTAEIKHYVPNTCTPHGAASSYTWTRTVIAHFNETLGNFGPQEMIRVRYRHSTADCKVYDEMMDFARSIGHVRWTAVCEGTPVAIWQAYEMTSNPVAPNLAYDCVDH